MLRTIGKFDTTPEEDLRTRIDGLKGLMADLSVDYTLIFENVNRFYFTGTMQKGLLAVPADGEPLLFIEKSGERAKMETPLPIIPVKNEKEAGRIIGDRLGRGGTIGLEMDVLPVAVFERLKRTLGFGNALDITAAVKELRIVKSPFEIEQLRGSGRISDSVFTAAKEAVREGKTELEIEADLVATGRRLGHHGALRMRGINQEIMVMAVQSGISGAIPTFVDGPLPGAGITPAVPHGATFKKVERGVPVTVDYVSAFNGYFVDETRAFVVGELMEIFRKPYETARAILEDALVYGREGIDSTELWERAYALVKKAGLEEHFMGHGEGQVRFLGHGVGLEVNELPVLTAKHKRVLRDGMAIALEPKFIFPPHGAIGIEISVIVRPDRLERLTENPMDLVRV